MPRPRPLLTMARVDPDSGGDTITTTETVFGTVYVSATGRPPGSALPVEMLVQLSAVSGTCTVRLREDSISGAIVATASVTSTAAPMSATGTVYLSTAKILVVTCQNSASTSTLLNFTVHIQGDGTDPEFDALSGTAYTELSPWAGGLMFRDDNDRVWLLDRDEETAYSRNQIRRVFPQLRGAGHLEAKKVKPYPVMVGSDIWVFSLGSSAPSLAPGAYDADTFELTVIDGGNGNVKITSVTQFVTGATCYAAVYDGSRYVWLFYANGSTTVTALKWDALGAATAPTSTTYITTAGAEYNALDATYLSATGDIAVVGSGFNATTGNAIYFHSYLDATTGAAKASPAAVVTTVTAAAAPRGECGTGIGIFENQTEAATTWRYVVFYSDPGSATRVLMVQKIVNGTTLAVTATTTLASFTVAALDLRHVGLFSGYYDNDDATFNYWYQLKSQYGAGSRELPKDLEIDCATDGSLVAVAALGSWLASKPFKRANGDWYVLTGYDDGEDTRAQRSMHVLPFGQSNVIAQIGYGEMCAAFYESVSDDTGGAYIVDYTPQNLAHVPPVVMAGGGTVSYAAVAVAGDTPQGNRVALLTLDWDATYSRAAVAYGDTLIYPGGIPQIAGPRDDLHDASPLRGPDGPSTAGLGGGGALATFYVATVYRFVDASGRIYRSPASATASHAYTNSGARTLTVRNLTHIGRGAAFIEVYGSSISDTTPRLQFVIANDPSNLTQTVAVTPERWSATTEPIYTLGGALVRFPPPACRSVGAWKDRIFVSGTTVDGEAWFSQEAADGDGIRLNPALRVNWGSADGPIRAMGAVDWNYFALLRRDGVAVIAGEGPDGAGSGGNYRAQVLTTRRGTEVPFSVVSGPNGLYFQSASDSLIYLVTPGLQVVDVSQGIASDLAGRTVSAASHMVGSSELWFFLDNGTIAVLDYKFPTQEFPAGQWYLWESDALTSACVGAVEESDGSITWLQADKGLRRTQAAFTDEDSAENQDPILMSLQTGKMPTNGEVAIERIKLLGQHVGTSTLRVAVTPDSGSAENHDVSTSSPVDYVVHPGTCLRVQEVELTIEETASTTEGFVIDGVDIEFNPRGHGKRLPSTKFI